MDMKAMMARLAELNNKNSKGAGGGKLKKVFKPKNEHDVRCLKKEGVDDPFVVRNFHGGIPNNGNTYPFSCPKNHGEECPVCDFAEALLAPGGLAAWKDENGNQRPENERKQGWEMFKKIQAKPRFYIPIIERTKEADGVQWWSFTENNYNELVKICTNVDWNTDRDDAGGDAVLTSPTSGLDLHLSYQEPGKKGNATTFTKVVITERKKMSKLAPTAAEAKKIIDSIYPLDETHDGKRVTKAEAHAYLSAYLNGGISEDRAAEVGKPDVEYVAPVDSANAEKLTGTKSVDEKLEELMGAS